MLRRAGTVALATLTFSLALGIQAAAEGSWPLDPRGPIAKEISSLYWLFFIVAVIVIVIVDGGLIYAGIKFRERPGHVAKQFHSHNLLEVTWTIIPTIMVVSMTLMAVGKLNYINDTSNPDMTVHVQGQQWTWIYTYPDQAAFRTRENKPLQAAEELHIPVGAKVKLELEAKDVIHSFFIPGLGGKKDAVPGRSTSLWIQADSPGTYKGQCSEFCGQGHADMLVTIVAHPKTDYDAWLKSAIDEYNKANGPEVAKGRETFLAAACVGCHTIKGTTAAGKVGPDLSKIGSAKSIAGVLSPVNAENLAKWIKNPAAVKPGTQMPSLGLSDQAISDIVSYLITLK